MIRHSLSVLSIGATRSACRSSCYQLIPPDIDVEALSGSGILFGLWFKSCGAASRSVEVYHGPMEYGDLIGLFGISERAADDIYPRRFISLDMAFEDWKNWPHNWQDGTAKGTGTAARPAVFS